MNSANQPVLPDAPAKGLGAIVLAAGLSSRMVEFKPLLPLAGAMALERSIGVFRAARIAEVIAVLGHRADVLRPLAERSGARSIVNEKFEQGMYSSIAAGCRALPGWVEAAFVLPADMPLVRPATVRQLAETWSLRRAGILYPVFDGHRGHPPLISRSILDQVGRGEVEGPLNAVLALHEGDAENLQVADQCIHLDMDTLADYDTLASLAHRQQIPTAAECEAILAARHVHQVVVRHARKVAEVAHRIASALLRSGLSLDLELVQAGALLHDIAKGESDHAGVGASILRDMEFPRVADIVAAHTDLDFSGSSLDEKALVYLADKVVRGVDLVTINDRFQPALDRFRNNPPALRSVERRLETARQVACAVESRLGTSLSAVVYKGAGSANPFPGPSIASGAMKI
jgi:putative nucleotidyltransferase with HDIG domain